MIFEALANLFQGRRAVGGKVTVTTKRLLFTPNRLDAVTGGRGLAVDRADICRVWIEQAGAAAIRQRGVGASLRPQVGIDHVAAQSFVVVRKPYRLAGALLADRT